MVSIKINVSLPTRKRATKKWLDSIASAQRSHSIPELRKLFAETTFGWSIKPRMGWSQSKSSDEISLRIYATGERSDVWNLLNEGSPAHIIRPRRKFISFRTGYRSSTRPGVIRSRRKFRSGKLITSNIVRHPGFEARKFTEMIAQEFATNFGMQMQQAVNEVANRL